MFIREENLRQSLDGICVSCKTTQAIDFREEWHLQTLYKIGTCPCCNYEHHVFVKKM